MSAIIIDLVNGGALILSLKAKPFQTSNGKKLCAKPSKGDPLQRTTQRSAEGSADDQVKTATAAPPQSRSEEASKPACQQPKA